MIIYTWVISALDCKVNENNLEKVVQTIHWRYKGEEDSVQSEVYGSVTLDSPDPNDFIPYENLTQVIVESWLESNLDVTQYQNMISDQIESIKNPAIITLPLPIKI